VKKQAWLSALASRSDRVHGSEISGVLVGKRYRAQELRWTVSDGDRLESSVNQQLSTGLLKLLQGKSCFHVKQLTPELRRDISGALEISSNASRKLGSI
jgi:hypothetical protein